MGIATLLSALLHTLGGANFPTLLLILALAGLAGRLTAHCRTRRWRRLHPEARHRALPAIPAIPVYPVDAAGGPEEPAAFEITPADAALWHQARTAEQASRAARPVFAACEDHPTQGSRIVVGNGVSSTNDSADTVTVNGQTVLVPENGTVVIEGNTVTTRPTSPS